MAKIKGPAAAAPLAEDRKWKAEDALRTLNRADEIQRDGKLMADVKKLAQQQIQSLVKHAAPEAAAPKKKASNMLMKG